MPWEEIVGVSKSYIPGFMMSPIWIIQVEKLTFLHRFFSAFYLFSFFPGIAISSNFNGADELLEEINKNIAVQSI